VSERPVPFRGGGFEPRALKAPALVAFVVLLAAWQLASTTGLMPKWVLPAPSDIINAFGRLAASGELLKHIQASLKRLLAGWAAGTIAGIGIGLAIGLFTLARSIGRPFLAALFPIPKIALLPLFIIWFGIDEGSKIATIILGVLFPTVVATYGAVDNVPRSLVRMAQSFGLSFGAIVRRVVLPAALPGILSGFRISSSIGIVLLTAAEMIGAEWGIGSLVLNAGASAQGDRLLAGVIVLSCFGLLFSAAISFAERVLLAWR
jgi:NitT/TauT family transport system permease protein